MLLLGWSAILAEVFLPDWDAGIAESTHDMVRLPLRAAPIETQGGTSRGCVHSQSAWIGGSKDKAEITRRRSYAGSYTN